MMRKVLWTLLWISTFCHAALLSPQEQAVVENHPLTCISTGEWAPFNFVKGSQLQGIGFDYWQLIKKRLHIKEKACKHVTKWTEVLSAIKNHTADMTIATQNTQERKGYAVFSKPYAEYPIVIVTKDDIGFIDNINLLQDKTIAIGKEYSTASILQQEYPTISLQYVDSINDALKMVDEGKVFATVGILPVISYKLNKHTFPNLKISGSIPARFSVSIMLAKEHQALVPLINKAIDDISLEERNIINKKWISLSPESKISPTYFYGLLTGSILLFLFFSVWLYLLKKEISQKDDATKELQRLVTIDALTSICNRYMFDITLDKEIALAQRKNLDLSLIFFDIDHFKKINDLHGHKVGDEILKELTRLVSQNIRKSDTFCRWGGDEFIIILPHTTEAYAKKLANHLSELIKAHQFIQNISLSCSFGVTQLREEDTHVSFVSRVDHLLYDAKRNPTE